MKKKKIAFIIGKMSQGGPARAILNLLPIIDYSKYDVSLVLFNAGGLFFCEIPKYVKIIYVKPRGLFCSFQEDKMRYLVWFPIKVILKFVEKILILIFKQKAEISWKLKEYFVKKNPVFFDLGMAFIEGIPIYYLSKYVNATVKIGRIPTDYVSAKLNSFFDFPYFQKLDYLFSITEENSKILQIVFPKIKDKVKVFELITSRRELNKKAEESSGFSDGFTGIRILTLSRIHSTKGTDLIIKASHVLKEKNINFRWYVMGDGNKKGYCKLISDLGLKEQINFMTPTNNPFPFLKQTDIYVQPSQYEGKSNAINEAKALCIPIIITKFTTSSEIIQHMENGLIADMTPDALVESIKLLIENPSLAYRFAKYWKENFKDNEDEANKIFNLIR